MEQPRPKRSDGKLQISRDRTLIRRRYESGAAVQMVAADLGRSVQAVYRALNRIHLALLDCIQRTLRAEARA